MAGNLTDCGCIINEDFQNCGLFGGDPSYIAYKTFGNISGQLNGRLVTLEQNPDFACSWLKAGVPLVNCGYHFYAVHIDFGILDCENLPAPFKTITFTECRYGISRFPNSLNIQIIAGQIILAEWDIDCSGGGSDCFDCTGTVTPHASCFFVGGVAPCELAMDYILQPGDVSWWVSGGCASANSWSISIIYPINGFVKYETVCYVSLVANNIGNQPDISDEWQLVP